MKKLTFVLATLLLLPAVLAIQVSPSYWNVEIYPGSTAQATFDVLNNCSNSTSVQISDSGYISNWLFEDPTQMSLNGFETKPFDAVIVVPSSASQGSYTGSINVGGFEIPVNVTVIKWRFEKSDWYKAGDRLQISPSGYEIYIKNVSRSVYIEISKGVTLLESKFFDVGDDIEYSDLYMKVLDRYGDETKLLIKTTDPSTTITTGKEQESQQQSSNSGGGSFSFYTSQYGNKFFKDTITKETFVLRNGLSESVSLKTISYEGTLTTPEGRKPIRIEDWTLMTLGPGEEKSFVVTIDTTGLELGEWRPILTVSGLTESGKQVSASIAFSISVISSASPPSTGEIKVTAPTSVDKGEQFEIKVENLPSGGSVMMQPNPNLVGTEVKKEDSKWIWKGYINSTESQTIELSIMQYGGLLKTYVINISVGHVEEGTNVITLNYIPQNPTDGSIVTVQKSPDIATVTVTAYEGDTVVDKFIYTIPFRVVYGRKYCLEAKASGYETVKKCFDVSLKKLDLIISPSKPTPSEYILIQAVSGGQPVSGVSIKVDDKVYDSSSVNIKLGEGEHTVVAYGDGYQNITKKINVLPEITVSGPTEVVVGQNATINLSREADWEVMYSNLVISEGSGSVVEFTPAEEGSYEIWADNRLVYVVEAKGGLMSVPVMYIGGGFALLLVVYILYKTFFRKKKLKQAPDIGLLPYGPESPIEKVSSLRKEEE